MEAVDSLADVIASIDYFLMLSLTKEQDSEILVGAINSLILGILHKKHRDCALRPAGESSPAQTETQSDEVDADSDSALDDETEAEIIEIFVEEAGEVQETIAEYLPAWEEKYEDSTL